MVFSTRLYITAVYQKCDSKKIRGRRCHHWPLIKPLISVMVSEPNWFSYITLYCITWSWMIMNFMNFITWYRWCRLGEFVRNGLLTISWQFNWPFSGGERLISFWQTGLSAAVPNAAPPPLAPPSPSPTDDTPLVPDGAPPNIGPARCWKFINPPASSAWEKVSSF